ncbi:hypothetical protein BDV11DRAFT_77644 [Aspergillus similis]
MTYRLCIGSSLDTVTEARQALVILFETWNGKCRQCVHQVRSTLRLRSHVGSKIIWFMDIERQPWAIWVTFSITRSSRFGHGRRLVYGKGLQLRNESRKLRFHRFLRLRCESTLIAAIRAACGVRGTYPAPGLRCSLQSLHIYSNPSRPQAPDIINKRVVQFSKIVAVLGANCPMVCDRFATTT